MQQLLTAAAPDFSYCRLTVTAEIIQCAAALLNNPVSGLLRLPYAEAKVLELLTLCVAAFGRLEAASVQQFSETDVARFHKAREILATKFSPPPTIASLARELAINETKLKSGFKALFGHTVFEYGHECRMQHALHLLRDKRISGRDMATLLTMRQVFLPFEGQVNPQAPTAQQLAQLERAQALSDQARGCEAMDAAARGSPRPADPGPVRLDQ